MALTSALELNAKVKNPVHKGQMLQKCASCSTLSEDQWTYLTESFTKRSAYRNRSGSKDDSFEEQDTDEPVFTGKDLSHMDTLLDLEPEPSSSSTLVTGISPLTNLLAPHLSSSHIQYLGNFCFFMTC